MPVAVQGGTVYFDEQVGSPSQIKASRYSTQNPINRSTARTGRILWSQIDLFIAECLPSPPFIPGQHPAVPYLYVDDITIVPEPGRILDCTGQVSVYETAVATVTYTPLDYTLDRVTRSVNFSMEAMNIPFSHQYWADKPDAADEDDPITGQQVTSDITAYKYIPVIELSYQFENVPVATHATIETAIVSNIGKLNKSVFDGHAIETLLFAGGRISYTFGNLGFQTYSYDYSFHKRLISENVDNGLGGTVEKFYGWNHFYKSDNAGGGTWDRLSSLPDKYKPVYLLSDDFADLFTGTAI